MSSHESQPGERLPRQFCFGDFTLDLDRGLLLHGDHEIPLRRKSFEVLVYLVEHHGKVAAKGRLIDAVWSDAAVTDNSLAQCLVEIRRALGDDAQRLIRTVAGRGYLFTAPVTIPVVEFPRPVTDAHVPVRPPHAASQPAGRRLRTVYFVTAGAALVGLAGIAAPVMWPTRSRAPEPRAYTQLTNFTDSAVSPALSPDGRMLAFIRSENWFATPDQIYVKLLPNGEPVQLTHDSRQKYGPTFSPDGSRVLYTVPAWATYAVSPLGGEPALFLNNASGVTWLDRRRILFSEANPPTSTHMGVVTANEDRSDLRRIYFPNDVRGMVHLSYPSPDRAWALVLEMNPVWQPCRVVPLDGASAGRQVGPTGKCTAAAWSPDGKWMYLGVEIEGNHHLWRQRFPDGRPEQITFGPTEEDGIAVAPDGRSLITSIGLHHSSLWIHDARGDRPLSSQGDVAHAATTGVAGSVPLFSRDGKQLYYLKSDSPDAPAELWRVDVASEKSERALPGVPILEFDISDDAQDVVYASQPPGKPSQVWLARLDRRSPPRVILTSGEDSPRFGRDGRIVFRSFDGANHHLEEINADGSGRSKITSYPVGSVLFMSTDRRWIATVMTMPDGLAGTYALPTDGGAAQRICSGCPVDWAPDGRFLYLHVRQPSLTDGGRTRVVPLEPGAMLPPLPGGGMGLEDDPSFFPGSFAIGVYGLSPGPDPSVYAYVRTTMQRNLFRIPLGDR